MNTDFTIPELLENNWQLPIDTVPDELWDVIIVGAGPAGSTAAIHLASQGHRVLLVDKKRFPRDKTCGDVLIEDAIRYLKRIGLYDNVCKVGHELHRALVFSPSRIKFEVPGTYIAVRRSILDSIIARKAVESGAIFCQGSVDDIFSKSNDSIECTFWECDRVYQARIGVIATGASVKLLRKLGMNPSDKANAVALRCYVRSTFSLDQAILSYDKSIIPGYGWIFPMGDNVYNVGCGIIFKHGFENQTNLREAFASFTTNFPLASELMQNGEQISPIRGALLRCGLNPAHSLTGKGNVLAVGETIDATFPFTGEGIGKAMETAELAAEVLHDVLVSEEFDGLREYPARLERDLRTRYVGYQIAQNWSSRGWILDLLARRARSSKFVRDSFAGIVTESVDLRDVFSLQGFIKSFWK